jgi:hypothetical protein
MTTLLEFLYNNTSRDFNRDRMSHCIVMIPVLPEEDSQAGLPSVRDRLKFKRLDHLDYWPSTYRLITAASCPAQGVNI